jgi:hypothetical protein
MEHHDDADCTFASYWYVYEFVCDNTVAFIRLRSTDRRIRVSLMILQHSIFSQVSVLDFEFRGLFSISGYE